MSPQEIYAAKILAFCDDDAPPPEPFTLEELAEYGKQGVRLWPEEEEERNDKS